MITLGACIAPAINGPVTQYIIVRSDLSRGIIAAQVAHAAGSGSTQHPPNTFVVVLAARSEEHLRSIHRKLELRDIDCTLIEETDPPFEGVAMSIGMGLVKDRTRVRKVVSNLPLLK